MSLWDLWRVREAAKIDFLEKQPGFAQTPQGKAAIHLLKTRYPKQGDPIFPLLMREYKNGSLLLSPHYLDHFMNYQRALEDGAPEDYLNQLREQLDGDRPDGYFWRPGEGVDPRGNPRMNPIQPGMIQNMGRMLRWMKGANQPLPNMDAKTTTLPQIEQMYHSWKSQYDRERDPSMGAVVHEFPDGWTMRSCDNDEQCYDEGEEMNHCGAKYAPLVAAKTHQLFSLRDPDNWPHASVVYRPGDNSIEDIRGKNNQAPNDRYTQYLSQWLPTLGEGVTISGHPNPMAPPIPEVAKFGLPVVGTEAAKQGMAEPEYDEDEGFDEHVASWQLTADKLNDYLRNPQSRPEFSDPDHPDYEPNKAFLDALERTFHNEQTDHLFPWFASEYLKGRLRHVDGSWGPEFHRQKSPEEHRNEVEEMIQNLRDRGYEDDFIQTYLQRRGPKLWHDLPREEVESIGDWLHNTNSQNPTRHGFDINRASWEDMLARVKDYEDWKRRKRSIEKAVHKFNDGYHWYPLEPGDVGWEGKTMQNCIGGYGDQIASGHTAIYSLRDKNGNPKVDMEIRPGAFFNPKTKEMMTPEEMQEERRKARGGRENCPNCDGNGWEYERDEDGEFLRDDYGDRVRRRDPETNRVMYCQRCNGSGVVDVPPQDARQDLDDFQPTPVNGKVVQVQGKQNKPPVDKYHPYVKDFVTKINKLAEKSGQHGPTWDLGKLHYNSFNELYDPENNRVIYYHPGDYGLPDPGVTSDYLGTPGNRDYYGNPGLLYSYLNSGTENDMNNRRRAKYMYHWALYNNDMDKLHEALNNEDLLNEVKGEVGNTFDPYSHATMREWIDANPRPQNELQVPNHYDEQGNPRWGTPEYEAEAQAWREAEEQQYLAERRWSEQQAQIAAQLKARAGEEVWPTSRQAQMLDYLHGYINGQPPETLPEGEEGEQHHEASVRQPWAPLCICGSDCEIETWDFIRIANDQVWNRTRNNLRRNNIYTPKNEIGWESLKYHYPDHSALSEWLHKEFRKGRFNLPPDAHYYMNNADRYEQAATRSEQSAAEAEARGDEAGARYLRSNAEAHAQHAQENLENARTFSMQDDDAHWTFQHPETGRNIQITPKLMDVLADTIKRRSQREKDFNYMRHEFPALAQEAHEEHQRRRVLENSGVTVFDYPDGYSMRYIPNGDVADLESELMGHCIRSYKPGIESGRSHNFSLRDEKGIPHITYEVHPKDPTASDFIDWDEIANDFGGMQRDRHAARVCENCGSPLSTQDDQCWKCGTPAPAEGKLPPELAAKKAEYEQWLKRQSTYGPSGYNNGGMSDELQDFLAKYRTNGLIRPNFYGGKIHQITGGRGSSPTRYAHYIKQYMDTIPMEDRPHQVGDSYSEINHVDQLPEDDGGIPTNQYGFRVQNAQHANYPTIVAKLWDQNDPLAAHRYDPARGEAVYNYAAKHNELPKLYEALSNWEKNAPQGGRSPYLGTEPACPECGARDDVQPVDKAGGDNQWVCTYCDTEPFDGPIVPRVKGGVQYTPYQAQAVQHLAPMLAQHPELVERATVPQLCRYCGSNMLEPYPGEPGYLRCQECGAGVRQASVKHSRRGVPHLNQYGERCVCLWGDNRHEWPRPKYANEWGEDYDSGEYIEPDHYPNVQNPRLDQALEKPAVMGDKSCPTCGDQMNELGECARCDWGGFNHSEDATNPWPKYPFSDENAGIRNIGSEFAQTIPEARWNF